MSNALFHIFATWALDHGAYTYERYCRYTVKTVIIESCASYGQYGTVVENSLRYLRKGGEKHAATKKSDSAPLRDIKKKQKKNTRPYQRGVTLTTSTST